MVAAAREHYVDDCEKEHGIYVAPVVRNAILDGTPVAVSEVRRLSLEPRDQAFSAASRRKSPPLLKMATPNIIPRRRGYNLITFDRHVCACMSQCCRYMKMRNAGLFNTWSQLFFTVERGILVAFSSEHILEQRHIMPLRDAMVVAEPSSKCAMSIITVEFGTVHLECDSESDRAAWMEAIEGNVGALEEAAEAEELQHRHLSEAVLDEQERMFLEQEALADRMASAQGAAKAQPVDLADYDFKAIIAAANDAMATGKKGSYVKGKVQAVFSWGKK
jgi:hypothetical protein